MDDIAKYFSVEKDAVYMIGFDKGEAKGEEKARTRFVMNLLTKTYLTIEQVADIASLSVEAVK